MAAMTNDFLYALRDTQFRAECEATSLEVCGQSEPGCCGGCAAWEGLKARVLSRVTAGEQPGVLVRSAP